MRGRFRKRPGSREVKANGSWARRRRTKARAETTGLARAGWDSNGNGVGRRLGDWRRAERDKPSGTEPGVGIADRCKIEPEQAAGFPVKRSPRETAIESRGRVPGRFGRRTQDIRAAYLFAGAGGALRGAKQRGRRKELCDGFSSRKIGIRRGGNVAPGPGPRRRRVRRISRSWEGGDRARWAWCRSRRSRRRGPARGRRPWRGR